MILLRFLGYVAGALGLAFFLLGWVSCLAFGRFVEWVESVESERPRASRGSGPSVTPACREGVPPSSSAPLGTSSIDSRAAEPAMFDLTAGPHLMDWRDYWKAGS